MVKRIGTGADETRFDSIGTDILYDGAGRLAKGSC